MLCLQTEFGNDVMLVDEIPEDLVQDLGQSEAHRWAKTTSRKPEVRHLKVTLSHVRAASFAFARYLRSIHVHVPKARAHSMRLLRRPM